MKLRQGIKSAFVAALLLLLVEAAPLHAQTRDRRNQTQTPTRNATPPATNEQRNADAETATEDADLSITAHVTARELRFEKVPNQGRVYGEA